jgi:hypothetical protein
VPGSATERAQAVRAAFADQAGWAEKLESPFMARLTATLGTRLDRSTEVGRRLLDWPGNPATGADNVTLRLCGGLHALVRSGAVPRLAACYPPDPMPDEDTLWAAVDGALQEHEAALLPWLDSPPQTNEVGRSAVLMAGLLVIADRFRQPVELLELGASAGLNMLLDLYRYDLGGLVAGDPASMLRQSPEWKGDPPPDAAVSVASREGVDLRPMDARRDGERLLAYVWPDQPARLRQLEAALAVAAENPPRVEQGEAADWLEAKLAAPAVPGRSRVVLHSIAFQYFPAGTQARIAAMMDAAGAAASEDRPLAWLRFEMAPGDSKPSLRLRLWPNGEDRLLAWCHPHGKSVRWLGDSREAAP